MQRYAIFNLATIVAELSKYRNPGLWGTALSDEPASFVSRRDRLPHTAILNLLLFQNLAANHPPRSYDVCPFPSFVERCGGPIARARD